MSAYGITEFERLYRTGPRAAIPGLPDVHVTDDSEVTSAIVAGFEADGRIRVRIKPDLIPGAALVWHETGHIVQVLVGRRLSAVLDPTVVAGLMEFVTREGFRVRGVAVNAGEPATEQWASMLPECFIGEWGGYRHPLYGLDPTSVRIASRRYFESSASADMRAFFRDIATTWMPTPEQTLAATPRPTWTPPAVPPALTPPTNVVDLRARLLRADFSYGKRGPNTSITLHWNGGPVAPDADPIAVLEADARFHVHTRGWDGISYHRAYWRDGTCFITRDWDDTLAASGDGMGNADSSHWQLMIGTGQSPTPEMIAAVARDIRAELAAAPLEVYPHRYWSSTTCPGDELAAWVDRRGWVLGEEDDVAFKDDPDAVAYKADVFATFEAIKEVLTNMAEDDAGDDAAVTALAARIDKLKTI